MSTHSPTISLTESEETLFKHLKDCAQWINKNPQEVDALRVKDDNGNWVGKERGSEEVELRIAGGWVRDKLLGQESDDIDVSTSPDPITGLKFALLFQKYLALNNQSEIMGKLTAIEAKPNQSKHLETATAMVCNLSVDWVQQRGNEIYDLKKRIPTDVTFGTPLEDAERRDLTINALFYNLNTSQIEDVTSKGLPDLRQKRIRTPVDDPFRTFLDDPLRVLRAVRFAARFGREWEIDEELKKAVGREEIQAALGDPTRISRERVGIELEKMFLGHEPLYALELIISLNLYPLIFLNPPSPTGPATPVFLTGTTPEDAASTPPPPPSPSLALEAAQILNSLLSPTPPTELHPLLSLQTVPQPDDLAPSSHNLHFPSTFPSELNRVYPTTTKRLFLSCSLLPLYGYSTYDKKPSNVLWVGEKVIRDGIKWSNWDRVWCGNAKKAWELIREGVAKWGREAEIAEEEVAGAREEIGMILRSTFVHDKGASRWNVSLLWSLVADLASCPAADQHQQRALVKSYNRFVERALAFGLEESAFAPSLLSGSDILRVIPSSKGSPAMASIIELVVRYQFAHPKATPSDCEQWLRGEEVAAQVAKMVEEAKALKKPKKQ